MISAAYCRTMTAYNAAMNDRLFAAAGRLPDAVRRAEAGAFWGTLHGTLNHLLWADRMWLSRLAGAEKPAVGLTGSAALFDEFEALARERTVTDTALTAWADGLADDALAGPMTWFSGALGRDATASRAIVVMHLFNHQTHHRGQAHAMITAAGESTGDTDLFILIPEVPP